MGASDGDGDGDDGGGGNGDDNGDSDRNTYSGDGWTATVTDDGNVSHWEFDPDTDASWADIRFDNGGWVGYRMESDGETHQHTCDASADGESIDVRFVWDDSAGGQYVSGSFTHEY